MWAPVILGVMENIKHCHGFIKRCHGFIKHCLSFIKRCLGFDFAGNLPTFYIGADNLFVGTFLFFFFNLRTGSGYYANRLRKCSRSKKN